ncbi:MAG: hypothetical protein MJZ41_06305 [Bacteroidaceae bacterium]|nr:hypothetical protein [Bacteroidaceae bacterium]
MKEKLYITIHCKRYVKEYLLRKYSIKDDKYPLLVNVNSNKSLKQYLYFAVKENNCRYDKRIHLQGMKKLYPVQIEISQDLWDRHGWELTMTAERALCSHIETYIKFQMMNFVKVQFLLTGNLSESIRQFYKHTVFDEWSWPPASISKIIERAKNTKMESLNEELSNKIRGFFMVQMSESLDICTV